MEEFDKNHPRQDPLPPVCLTPPLPDAVPLKVEIPDLDIKDEFAGQANEDDSANQDDNTPGCSNPDNLTAVAVQPNSQLLPRQVNKHADAEVPMQKSVLDKAQSASQPTAFPNQSKPTVFHRGLKSAVQPEKQPTAFPNRSKPTVLHHGLKSAVQPQKQPTVIRTQSTLIPFQLQPQSAAVQSQNQSTAFTMESQPKTFQPQAQSTAVQSQNQSTAFSMESQPKTFQPQPQSTAVHSQYQSTAYPIEFRQTAAFLPPSQQTTAYQPPSQQATFECQSTAAQNIVAAAHGDPFTDLNIDDLLGEISSEVDNLAKVQQECFSKSYHCTKCEQIFQNYVEFSNHNNFYHQY